MGQGYDLVGGITRVVVRPAKYLTLDEFDIELTLHDCGSSYEERVTLDDSGGVEVVHTLTTVGYHGEEEIWARELRRAACDGVVADVTLNSGAKIKVGWSEQMGARSPLKLVEVEVVSGEKPLDKPLKKMVWRSIDKSRLL